MESLISKLKAQLLQKDKRLGQLKEAIKALEARLIDAMKAAATDDMNLSQNKSVEAQVRPIGPPREYTRASCVRLVRRENIPARPPSDWSAARLQTFVCY
eukprot:2951765-Pyramimonas_sp.AAC.1